MDKTSASGGHSEGGAHGASLGYKYPLEHFELISKQNEKLSEDMQRHLTNLSKRLKSLERNTTPLHQETAGLQNHLKNIDVALKHVSLIMGYYAMHDKHSTMLSRESIESVSKFLVALKEIKEAEEFFSSANVGIEAKDLKNDFDKGNERLFAHFRSELHALSVIDDSFMGQLESKSQQFIKDPTNKEVETIPLAPDLKIIDLKEISFWLCRGFSERFDVVSSYSSARSEFLLQTIKTFCDSLRAKMLTRKARADDFEFLRTYQVTDMPHVPRFHQRRKNKLSRTVAVNPSLHMESVGLGGNSMMGSLLGGLADGLVDVIDSGVGGVKRVGVFTSDVVVGTGDVMHKVASETAGVVNSTINAIPLMSGNALFSSDNEHKSSFLADPNLDDIDVMLYVQLVSAFHQLCLGEARLVVEIIPRNKEPQAFETLCRESARKVRFDIEKLLGACIARVRAMKTDLLALQCLFPLVEFFRLNLFLSGVATSAPISPSGNVPPVSLQREYYVLYRKMIDALKFCLDTFYDNIKSDNRNMPSDATVDELTVKSMMYLELILFYRSVYSVTINVANNPELNKMSLPDNTHPPTSRYHALPANLFQLDTPKETEIISSLFSCLCSKLSPALSKNSPMDDTREKLFMFNNLSFVLEAIQRFDVSLISCYGPVKEALERTVQVAKMDFMTAWRKLNNNSLNRAPNIAPNELKIYLQKVKSGRFQDIKMQEAERESVKNLFATFNSDFEAIHSLHKSLSVPDKTLYQEIRAEIDNIVVKPYTAFFNKYEKLPFTKYKEKYVKYTPESLVKAIDECYGQQ